jgi:hypothetical protein
MQNTSMAVQRVKDRSTNAVQLAGHACKFNLHPDQTFDDRSLIRLVVLPEDPKRLQGRTREAEVPCIAPARIRAVLKAFKVALRSVVGGHTSC